MATTEAVTCGRPPTSPVRDRNFLTYLGGVATADVGDQAWLTALAFTAAQTGRPLAATLVVAAGTIPRAVLALVGGAVADRLPSRPLLIGASSARVLVLVGGLIGLWAYPGHRLAVVVVVAALFGAADALHIPTVGTMPRQLVPSTGLLAAASLRQLVQRMALLGGPPLVGIVLAAFGLRGALIGLVLVFTVAAVLLSSVRIRYPRGAAPAQPVLRSIQDVLGYLRRESNAGGLVLALVGLNFFVIPVIGVGVALRSNQEGWGPLTLGLLLGAIGFGAAVGTAITLRFRPNLPVRFALAMLMLQGVSLSVVGFAPRFGVGAAMVAVGLTSGLASPLLSGIVQTVVDEHYLGRVFSLISLSDNGLLPIALVGYGLLSHAVGLGVSCAVCGAGMLLLMLTAFLRPALRRLRVEAAEPEPGPAT